jgi:hypothetical protein
MNEQEQQEDAIVVEALRAAATTTLAFGKDGTFTTKFVHTLERRKTGESENPKIELNLPYLVKITAPSYDW